MRHNVHPAIRELILGSLAQMISSRSSHIRSGWKSIFVVLSKAATPPSHAVKVDLRAGSKPSMTVLEWEKLLKTSFGMISLIFKRDLEVVINAGAFVDYVSALAEFALLEGSGAIHDDVVASSLRMMGDCGKLMVDHAIAFKPPPEKTVEDVEPAQPEGPLLLHQVSVSSMAAKQLLTPYLNSNGLISEDHFYLKWFPLISAMGRVITDSVDNTVQTRMIEILFDTLNAVGLFFEIKYWKAIHRSVILPIFEDFKEFQDDKKPGAATPANIAIWPVALQRLIDLFASILVNLTVDGLDLLQGLFELIVSMLSKRDDKLAMTGQVCLQQFIQKNIGKFANFSATESADGQIWDIVTNSIEQATWATIPAELLVCQIPAAAETSEVSTSNEDLSSPQKNSPNLARAIEVGNNAAIKALSRGNIEKEVASITDLDMLDFEYTIIKCGTHLELMEGLFRLMQLFAIFALQSLSQKETTTRFHRLQSIHQKHRLRK